MKIGLGLVTLLSIANLITFSLYSTATSAVATPNQVGNKIVNEVGNRCGDGRVPSTPN